MAVLPAHLAAQDSASPRQRVPLAEGWQFNLAGTDAAAAERPHDEDWEVVSVPHTWNRVGYYLSDPASHTNTAETVNKVQGVGWYYNSFAAPTRDGQGRAFLEFDAASRTAEVWLNGRLVGTNRNPFARFRIDVTDAVTFGGTNALYVKVDNTAPLTEGAQTADVLPMTGDFFVRGGLYRPVSLVLTKPVHFDLLDAGGPGVYATTLRADAASADIALTMRARNDSSRPQGVVVTATLLDAQGTQIASTRAERTLAAGELAEVPASLTVSNPRLWSGVADPYLHTLRFELRSAAGELLDSVDQSFGIRTMALDPERGFILNGAPYRLVGVGFHQDNEQTDWAMTPAQVEESIRIIREMGANSIRLTHYQHGQPVHDLADRYGLVLWDEIGLVTAWTNQRDQTETPAGIVANARQQVADMIAQNRNHASVAVWGIANEVDFGPGRPDFLGRPPEVVADPIPLLEELAGLVRSTDASRPVVLAHCCENRGMVDVPEVAETVDAVGANLYYGWYYGRPQDLGPHLDGLRAKRPGQPLSISEYGAGAADTLHTDNPLGGPIDMGGRTQPEEYASWFHEESWKQLEPRTYLWGTWLWNSFDFGTTVRREGDAQDINTKGLVSYDRSIRKDAYYFYRANWSDNPTVHINGRRYVDRAYQVTDVRVYSNASRTTLTVNGQVIGTLADCPHSVCVWPNVALREGENVVVASADFASGPVEDRVTWQLAASQVGSFRIDSGAILAANAEVRFGSDNFFVGGSAGNMDQTPRGRPPVPASIAGTSRRDIAATYRRGDFHYRLPLADGRYRVALTFVEPDKAVGERVFDVLANGTPVLSAYDVRARAGAVLTEQVETVEATVTGGVLDLHFRPVTGEAIVSAVEISALR
ncbi:glycoside hydrolase family 2 TIM barrel-domain containing protein [Alteraurantiacibacter buctensis]|uniref:glycoside hydrolase family 2 TIM barrel-domain containing protein n=1 Tax=Alteraurantiacibacter buctensis TaxID=1503981 RepID=UPI00301B7BE1